MMVPFGEMRSLGKPVLWEVGTSCYSGQYLSCDPGLSVLFPGRKKVGGARI